MLPPSKSGWWWSSGCQCNSIACLRWQAFDRKTNAPKWLPQQLPDSKGKWFESLREYHYNYIHLHCFSPSWTLFKSIDHSTLWQRVTFPAVLKADGSRGQHGVLALHNTAQGKPDWSPTRWNVRNVSPSIGVIMWEITHSTDSQLNRSITKANATKNS